MTYEEAFQKVEERFAKFSDFGAQDTEPDWHKENEIRRYLNGEDHRDLDVDQWELYDQPGAKAAAKSLNGAMKKLYNIITKTTVKDTKKMTDFFRSKFWRVEV
jgi:hypothetical protein